MAEAQRQRASGTSRVRGIVWPGWSLLLTTDSKNCWDWTERDHIATVTARHPD